jgi:hypothetical protein
MNVADIRGSERKKDTRLSLRQKKNNRRIYGKEEHKKTKGKLEHTTKSRHKRSRVVMPARNTMEHKTGAGLRAQAKWRSKIAVST